MTAPTVKDLVAVIYSSGKVFDGLTTGRLDTVSFIVSGDAENVASRHDLMLLQDLKAVAEFVIAHQEMSPDARYLMNINAQMEQTASMQPGVLRRANQQIGVNTVLGRHEPEAMTEEELTVLVADALQQPTADEKAVALFVQVAKAQPFMDGNKRTALFAANSVLLAHHTQRVLTVPVDDDDPRVAQRFSELLARAYIWGETEPVSTMLLDQGIIAIAETEAPVADEAELLEEFTTLLSQWSNPESE